MRNPLSGFFRTPTTKSDSPKGDCVTQQVLYPLRIFSPSFLGIEDLGVCTQNTVQTVPSCKLDLFYWLVCHARASSVTTDVRRRKHCRVPGTLGTQHNQSKPPEGQTSRHVCDSGARILEETKWPNGLSSRKCFKTVDVGADSALSATCFSASPIPKAVGLNEEIGLTKNKCTVFWSANIQHDIQSVETMENYPDINGCDF